MVARVNVRSWKSVSGMSGSDTLSSVTTKSTAASTAPPTIHAVVALAHSNWWPALVTQMSSSAVAVASSTMPT